MFIGFEQIAVSTSVLKFSDLVNAVKSQATYVELQADTHHVRFTMDGATDPTTSAGMLLLITEPPRQFLGEDLKNIRFIRDGAADCKLNIHYGVVGRQIT